MVVHCDVYRGGRWGGCLGRPREETSEKVNDQPLYYLFHNQLQNTLFHLLTLILPYISGILTALQVEEQLAGIERK